MNDFYESLYQMVVDTCRHPPKSRERREGLTRIIRFITQSGKLWQENTPEYEDALQQTWLYFCRNLCEANTTKHPYDSNLSSVVTWLDKYLKRRLQDFRLEKQQEIKRMVQPQPGVQPINDTLAKLPAPVTPSVDILEETREWVKTDPDGELAQIHIQGHPEVNCQVLIWRRLPPRNSWQKLSEEFGIPISTLNNFYRRQCFPRLRKFGEIRGYLIETSQEKL